MRGLVEAALGSLAPTIVFAVVLSWGAYPGEIPVSDPRPIKSVPGQPVFFEALGPDSLITYSHERVALVDTSGDQPTIKKYALPKGVWDFQVCFWSRSVVIVGLWEIANAGRQAVLVYDFEKKATLKRTDLPKGFGLCALAASRPRNLVAWTEFHHYQEAPPVLRVNAVDGEDRLKALPLELDDKYQRVDHLTFSPDGSLLAMGCNAGCGGVGVIDVRALKVLWRKRRNGGLGSITFGPDGSRFYATGEGGIVCYDAKDGTVLSKLPDQPEMPAYDASALTPDGEFILAGWNLYHCVDIWRVKDWKLVSRIRGAPGLNTLALLPSPDGKAFWAGDIVRKGSLDLVAMPEDVRAAPQPPPPSGDGGSKVEKNEKR